MGAWLSRYSIRRFTLVSALMIVLVIFFSNWWRQHIATQLETLGLTPAQVRRFWLHQANLSMNQLIGKRLLGHEPSFDEAPVILDEFANTASAGSIIAFHRHSQDLQAGDVGVICSFGAGYSIGSLVVRKQ